MQDWAFHDPVVNGCAAHVFVPPHSPDTNRNGLLLACIRRTNVEREFAAWTQDWVNNGFVLAGYDWPEQRYIWGADAAMDTLDALYQWVRARWDTRPRPAVCGTSRGGQTAAVWAHRRPNLLVAWFGINPVLDVVHLYDQPNRPETLHDAYGIKTRDELVKVVAPRASPVLLAHELTWLPLCTWQGRDDEVTPPQVMLEFDRRVNAAGGNHTYVLAPGGHATSNGPRHQIDSPAQIAFVRRAESAAKAS